MYKRIYFVSIPLYLPIDSLANRSHLGFNNGKVAVRGIVSDNFCKFDVFACFDPVYLINLFLHHILPLLSKSFIPLLSFFYLDSKII